MEELQTLLDEIPRKMEKEELENQVKLLKPKASSIWLRLIDDILDSERIEETMKAPIQAIVKHKEHGVLYSDDLGLGMPIHLINSCLRLVEENVGDLQICEVGAGTCGLTRMIVKMAQVKRYVVTDVSVGFLANVESIIGGLKKKREKKRKKKRRKCLMPHTFLFLRCKFG